MKTLASRTLAIGILAVGFGPGLPATAIAGSEETAVSTRATLFVGFPSGERASKGALVVPGMVIPSLGQGPTTLPSLRSEEERTRALTRITRDLTGTFRLERVEASFSESHALEIDDPVELSPPTPGSTLRITVDLLGFDRGTATYRVRFVDRNVVLADTRVAAARGRNTVIGGLDGDSAPYLFLVLEPAAPLDRPADGTPLKVGDGITAPRRVDTVMPEYTVEARKERIQGFVILQTVIGKDGTVSDVQVLKGLPYGLSEAAADAIRQWTFEPAHDANDNPVEVFYNLTVNFTLEDEEEDEGAAAPPAELEAPPRQNPPR